MKTTFRYVLFPISLLFLFALALFAERLVFFYKYRHGLLEFPLKEIAWALLLGVRYDFSIGAILSLPFILIFFILFLAGKKGRTYIRPAGILLLIWYVLLLVYGYIDIEAYRFVQRHLTFELESTWKDAGSILITALEKYTSQLKILLPIIFLFAFVFLRVLKKFSAERAGRGISGFTGRATSILLISALWVFFLRGGVQMKPLGVKDAFRNGVELGMLSLNGLFTTFSTIWSSYKGRELLVPLQIKEDRAQKEKLISELFSGKREESLPEYPAFRHFKYGKKDLRRLNVVIFLMESWSGKFTGCLEGKTYGRSVTPFFDELSKNGLLLTNCFASGQRSIEGITSLLASIPSSKSFVSHMGGLLYQTRVEPLGEILKRRGYRRLFMQGAKPGSMGFSELARKMGIEKIITSADFPAGTAAGPWGIYDEDVFLRAEREFSSMNGPFFAVVYSLTSHSPYKVPSSEFEVFGPEVPYGDFLNSLEYSDHALQKFFEKARSSAYFKNTLFIILGDHTEGPSTTGNAYELHRIPCLFYSADEKLNLRGKFTKPVAQADIVPSIIDLLRMNDPFTSLGKSIFEPGPRRVFINFRDSFFIWVKEPYMLVSGFDAPQYIYDYRKGENRNDPALVTELQTEALQYVRLFYSLVAHNQLKPP